MAAGRHRVVKGADLRAAAPGNRQQGVALFVTLAMLLILGMAGASAIRTTILEERMARNAGDSRAAFQAAEAALRQGEAFLVESIDSTGHFTEAGDGGLWTPAPSGAAERWALPGIWDAGSQRSREVPNRLERVALQPRYIVEWLADLPADTNPHLIEESTVAVEERVEIFRVTARGVGRSANTEVMLQSTFGLLL